MKESNDDHFLKTVFDQILSISKGKCTLTDEVIFSNKNELHRSILEGLLFLHQDLELYKIELREAMEMEYKLKILEEKNSQLEQFKFAASHDLKEPIRTITSFSSLILQSNKDNLNKQGKEYLDFVISASTRMWALLTGLLNYTEVGMERTLSNVNIKELVATICQDLYAQIQEKKVDIQIQNLPIIEGYGLELRQLFQNLISNALKFSKNDNFQTIKIAYHKVDGAHQFSIEDNGIGIKKEYQSSIFEIFRRLNRKDEYEGTGIGLAMCQRIVAMHYGRIWVESAEGKGSKFFFTIANKILE